ncbi:alpha/beta fold hydrolase [Nocardia sp. ET3-3]|uniref:Alpha/beta fold hydrolase n=1 Tax=Nocardia terrae TaxID=2675851 RepID=A0A7K1V8S7_9NOCA|nr:alpha/beta hydrolase [Nocardia terrae]MVU82976.1 alpha/beta fold hydrolase [Nocardia terrae]
MRAELTDWMSKGNYFDFDGHRIFYVREGKGPTLLLIHGYPFNTYDWHRIWPDLTAHYDVIAPDMLGMGFSDKPIRHHYSVLEHADMHEALLRHLGAGETLLLAHDLGVSVAQELLARRLEGTEGPDIRAVVLLNGGLFYEVYRPRVVQKLLGTPLGHLVGPLLSGTGVTDVAVREMFGPDTKPDADDMRTLREVLLYGNGRFVNHLVGRFVAERAVHRDRWAEPLIRKVVPTRLINGPLDPNSGAHLVARYRELVADPDVVSLPGIGHWPQLEDPAGVFNAAHAFLRTAN